MLAKARVVATEELAPPIARRRIGNLKDLVDDVNDGVLRNGTRATSRIENTTMRTIRKHANLDVPMTECSSR